MHVDNYPLWCPFCLQFHATLRLLKVGCDALERAAEPLVPVGGSRKCILGHAAHSVVVGNAKRAVADWEARLLVPPTLGAGADTGCGRSPGNQLRRLSNGTATSGWSLRNLLPGRLLLPAAGLPPGRRKELVVVMQGKRGIPAGRLLSRLSSLVLPRFAVFACEMFAFLVLPRFAVIACEMLAS